MENGAQGSQTVPWARNQNVLPGIFTMVMDILKPMVFMISPQLSVGEEGISLSSRRLKA